MATDRKQIRSYVDDETKEKFTQICKSENRSESNMVEYLIKKCIEEYEAKQERAEHKNSLKESSNSKIG
ncbi:MAG: ribbon-helix-helix domain-containing protein [Lacrimispora sphenoides]